jgi:hypothetical protein
MRRFATRGHHEAAKATATTLIVAASQGPGLAIDPSWSCVFVAE